MLSFAARPRAAAVRAAVHASYQARGVVAEVRILPFDNQGLVEG